MQLNDFLLRHSIVLSKNVLELCNEGLEIMQKSSDKILHDVSHLDRLFQLLDSFLSDENNKGIKLNFEVLITAICWHDVWRSKRIPINYSLSIFHLFWDGLGSMFMFKEAVRKYNFPKEFIQNVMYTIRKHALLQFLSTKTLEAKLLYDLDSLEEWSPVRFDRLVAKNEKKVKDNVLLYELALFYFKNYMMKINFRKKLHFDWTIKKAINLRVELYSKVMDFVDNYKPK